MKEIETDVIVVGYGSAGGAAAISANENGADVIILEKMSIPGGNSRVSAGGLCFPKYETDARQFAEYLKEVCFKTVESEIVDTFVEGLMEYSAWLRTMGAEIVVFDILEASCSLNNPTKSFSGLPSAEGLELELRWVKKDSNCLENTGGDRLWNCMAREVGRRGIKVLLSTPAKEIVKNQEGEVTGVLAKSENGNILFKAKKGVILTCGGFENDDALKWDNLEPKPIVFLGNPGNTGDGIRMVQKAGAALWHMSRQETHMGFKAPEHEAAFFISFLTPGFIYVDKYGRRFDESHIECHEFWRPLSHFNTERFDYPRVPFYAIFDEELRRFGPIHGLTAGYHNVMGTYKWSLDNSAEISRGWIIKAKKISDLAKRISIDPSTLENTIARYNEFCKIGEDTDFNRPKELIKAIEGPPYYAIQLWPALINTQGGPRRDKEARVLDADHKPIPRLYAAGEFGAMWGFLYQDSTNLSESIVFGRIAGKNAAVTPPLE